MTSPPVFFNLSGKDAALKLASDFGISYDFLISAKRKIPEMTEAERKKHQMDFCYNELCDYRNELAQWKGKFAPKTPEEKLHPLYLEAVNGLDQPEYQLDILLSGSDTEKLDVLNELQPSQFSMLYSFRKDPLKCLIKFNSHPVSANPNDYV